MGEKMARGVDWSEDCFYSLISRSSCCLSSIHLPPNLQFQLHVAWQLNSLSASLVTLKVQQSVIQRRHTEALPTYIPWSQHPSLGRSTASGDGFVSQSTLSSCHLRSEAILILIASALGSD